MDEESNDNNSPPETELRLFNSISHDVMLNTGEWTNIREITMRPLFDCHMHIQSLHATPMPLQWGTAFLRAGLFGRMHGDGRREVTMTTAGGNLADKIASIVAKDIGKVGRLSTDLIAKLYMSDIKNGDFKQTLEWTLTRREVRRADRHERASSDSTGETEPIMPALEALSLERERLLQDFYKATAYYYSDTQVFYLSFTMPMDLSYAHFWGAHGLPINLSVPGENTFYYIDDLHHIRCSSNSSSARVKRKYEPSNNPYEPHIDGVQVSYHLSYCFDFQKELENYINYMGQKEGLEEYTSPSEENAFYTVFDHANLVAELAGKESAEEKRGVLNSHKERFLNDELTYSINGADRKAKYMHYLQEIPGATTQIALLLTTLQQRLRKDTATTSLIKNNAG